MNYRQMLSRLTDLDYIARLDVPGTAIITSFDPTGGNDDFNHPLRVTDDGWAVLADLKGPGYVARFWFTGADPKHRVRFFFDNEKTPRIDLSIGEFCGGLHPFRPPLAVYENYCWYNYVPIPYAKRLIIMTQKGGGQPDGGPKLFHQINYIPLPRNTKVESFNMKLPPSDENCLAEAAQCWNKCSGCACARLFSERSPTSIAPAITQFQSVQLETTVSNYCNFLDTNIFIVPGGKQSVKIANGPAVIRELVMAPDLAGLASPALRQSLLRDLILKINWDGRAEPSVAVPFGSFFGSVWYKTSFQSMFFGMQNDSFFCRFPMPYRSAAAISFENQLTRPVNIKLTVRGEKNTGPLPGSGYFHTAWQRTTPAETGRPHTILNTTGKGRYAGCILSALSLDNSFWLLEGDEVLRRDSEKKPFWHGTGLEDYFNGGWYYQNVLAHPLNGLLFKSFFRTVQYRIHLPDPVLFKSKFSMTFERGPEHKSRGWLESVAFYYLQSPLAAPSELLSVGERIPPVDNPQLSGFMLDIFNYERFGDYRGAVEYIDAFTERYPNMPFGDMLKLRKAAYLEKMSGFKETQPVYQSILSETKDVAVQKAARSLLWFHEQPYNAVIGLYANAPARCFVDGNLVSESTDPAKLVTAGLELKPGRHTLALQCAYHPYPAWVQVSLRTHSGTIITDPSWKNCVNPPGDWAQTGYDDNSWQVVGGTGCKGPPEEPFVWIEPNAFIDMQSYASGIFCSIPWLDKTKPIVFRHEFEILK
jgi:hypothetical protein